MMSSDATIPQLLEEIEILEKRIESLEDYNAMLLFEIQEMPKNETLNL